MTRQHWVLIAISLAMCVHALWAGDFLRSPFALVAIAWLWIGGATVLDRLEAAHEMAIAMSVLLLAASIGLGIAGSREANILAHLSLALVPAVVAFACVAVYVPHLRQHVAETSALKIPVVPRKVAAMPRPKPQAIAAPPIVLGSDEGLRLPVGANDHDKSPASAARNDPQAA